MCKIEVRVGIPRPGGALVAAARAVKLPVLFSANALAIRKDREVIGFRLDAARKLAGMNAALDSAGFVAAVKYGDFPWSVEQYIDLAAAHAWKWYAAMDLCVEEAIAGDACLRRIRIDSTVWLLHRCRREARERGIADPMPVLQGWAPSDYKYCLDQMGGLEDAPLIGIGSVCRREVHGPDGILAIVDALDTVLPPGARLHLFGVKSTALQFLAGHQRIQSTDSMAWDYGLRREVPVGRTQDLRARTMIHWHSKQIAHIAAPRRTEPLRYKPCAETFTERVARLVGSFYGSLARHGDIEYADARILALKDMPLVKHLLPSPEAVPAAFADPDHDFGLMGLWEYLRENLAMNDSFSQSSPI